MSRDQATGSPPAAVPPAAGGAGMAGGGLRVPASGPRAPGGAFDMVPGEAPNAEHAVIAVSPPRGGAVRVGEAGVVRPLDGASSAAGWRLAPIALAMIGLAAVAGALARTLVSRRSR